MARELFMGIDVRDPLTGIQIVRRTSGEVQIVPGRGLSATQATTFRLHNMGPDDIEAFNDIEGDWSTVGLGSVPMRAANNITIRLKKGGDSELAIVMFGPASD